MSEIEKMRRYIERTKMKSRVSDPCCITYSEAQELGQEMKKNDDLLLEFIGLIFDYGKAKGYRAAKAEVRA